MIWLDAPSNRKGNANENLARELLELFTLGVGRFTETDVREAARALTGWTVVEGAFREVPEQHDPGNKTILGRTGPWRAPDLLRLLLEQPATAERLAVRLCGEFFGEGAVDAAAVRTLAAGLREHDLDVAWAVETILRSRAFFAESNLGNRVLGPVEYVIGAVRALALFDPPPSTVVLAEWTKRIGQELFYPPNVGGWPGGRWWITAHGLVGRDHFATALVEGEFSSSARPLDLLALAQRYGHAGDLDAVLTFFAVLLLGRRPTPAWREQLKVQLGPRPAATPETTRRAVALMLASPEAQIA